MTLSEEPPQLSAEARGRLAMRLAIVTAFILIMGWLAGATIGEYLAVLVALGVGFGIVRTMTAGLPR